MNAAAFQATFSDWRLVKGRKVVQIVFEVPLEGADQAYDVLGGMPDPSKSVWCGIARLKNGGGDPAGDRTEKAPGPTTSTRTDRARRSWDEMSPAQQAGILCSEPSFGQFLAEFYSYIVSDEHDAAGVVRELCHVDTRRDIGKDEWSDSQWKNIVADYRAWQRIPEVVG